MPVVAASPLAAVLGSRELSLDLEEAVVLREPFRLGDGADLDVLGSPADGQVGEPVVLGVAAPCADDDRPARFARSMERSERFGERSHLVGFQQ